MLFDATGSFVINDMYYVEVMIVEYKIGIRDLNPQDPHDSLQ